MIKVFYVSGLIVFAWMALVSRLQAQDTTACPLYRGCQIPASCLFGENPDPEALKSTDCRFFTRKGVLYFTPQKSGQVNFFYKDSLVSVEVMEIPQPSLEIRCFRENGGNPSLADLQRGCVVVPILAGFPYDAYGKISSMIFEVYGHKGIRVLYRGSVTSNTLRIPPEIKKAGRVVLTEVKLKVQDTEFVIRDTEFEIAE